MPSAKASPRRGWLAIGLVVAAVLLIIGLKMLRSGPTGGLIVAESAAPAAVPTLATSAAVTALPTVAEAQEDPWPTRPEAQVEWVLRHGKPALILFHSTNCKPCIAMSALVEEIRPAYASKVVFIDVVTNDSTNANLVRRAGIRAIPTTFFISASGEGRGYLGLMKEEDVRAELDRLVSAE